MKTWSAEVASKLIDHLDWIDRLRYPGKKFHSLPTQGFLFLVVFCNCFIKLQLLVSGASAYSRHIDYARLRVIFRLSIFIMMSVGHFQQHQCFIHVRHGSYLWINSWKGEKKPLHPFFFFFFPMQRFRDPYPLCRDNERSFHLGAAIAFPLCRYRDHNHPQISSGYRNSLVGWKRVCCSGPRGAMIFYRKGVRKVTPCSVFFLLKLSTRKSRASLLCMSWKIPLISLFSLATKYFSCWIKLLISL
jgi:hypothetical protein